MKLYFEIVLDTDQDSPNALGEMLRSKFWPPKKPFEYGCYSNFTYAPYVRELPIRREKIADAYTDPVYGYFDEEWVEWNRAFWDDFVCEWYWDGDGTLRFILPDGTRIINTDCKTDYKWEWENGQT